MKVYIFTFAVVSAFMLSFTRQYSSNTDAHILPIQSIQNWFDAELELTIEELGLVQNCIAEEKSKSASEQLKNKARTHFKKIEFLLFYLDPQSFNTDINGAPLPKIMKKVPDLSIIEPKGFQRLEELFAEEQLDQVEALELLEKLIRALETYKTLAVRSQINDAVVFEAMRYGIIRIQTMGITGFDAPGTTENVIMECQIAMSGLEEVFEDYRDYLHSDNKNKIDNLFALAEKQLVGQKFEEFDRAAFIIEVLDPLWFQILNAQKHLLIELPHLRNGNLIMPVNYEANSLFSNDLLNVDYYGEHGAYSSEKIQLGQLLFFDPILSANNKRACASCHRPGKAFTDGNKTSLNIDGESFGPRNALTLLNMIYSEKFFHDLRVDKLSAQMDHVVLNPDEFNTNYVEIVQKLRQSEGYKELFAAAYGAEGITRNTVTNAVTNYVASLRSFNASFDRYIRGETKKIDKSVIRGFNLFMGKAACATCHFTPTFSGLVPPFYDDSESEVLGVPEANIEPYKLDPDLGRYGNGLIKERADFYRNSFKTPTIRNIELTAPYMHNGAFNTLEEVVEFYNNGGGFGIGIDVPNQTLPGDSLQLSKREQKDLVAFMKSLTDTTHLYMPKLVLPEVDGLSMKRTVGGDF